MNPASFRIDSPTPHQAAADAQGYFDLLFPALETGGQIYTPVEFRDDVESGELLVLRVWDGEDVKSVTICRVQQTFRGPELYALACAGEGAKEWIHPLMETLYQVATEAKCVAVVLDGRRGWQKMLKDEGYSVFQARMRKEVSHGLRV